MSKRISLAIMSEDSISTSFYEGEYDTCGLKGAIHDARYVAIKYRPNRYPAVKNPDTHVAVIVLPINLGGKIKVLKKFQLTRTD